MGRRSLFLYSILLLCYMAVSCSKDIGTTSGREQEAVASGEQLTEEKGQISLDGESGDSASGPAVNKDNQSDNSNRKPSGEGSGSIGSAGSSSEEGIGSPEDAGDAPGDTNDSQTTGKDMTELETSGEDQELKDRMVTMEFLEAYTDSEELRKALRVYPSGTGVDTHGWTDDMQDKLFYAEELTQEIKDRINGKSYGEDCTIPYEELRYLRVLYRGFDGGTYIGELIVNQAITQDILDIFRELYAIDYPIERMVLVDDYDADDDLSMAANNTSAFNFRFVAGTTRLSKHSLGCAIDINPLYNPYITKLDGKTAILPKLGAEYVDRTKDCPYYIRKGDPCYEAFISRGFTWGGAWENSKDYQHFQKLIE